MDLVSELILREYPYPIAKCYERLIRTREVSERWEAVRYLFEASLKYCACVSIASYWMSGHADAATNAAFNCLSRPSLGHWLNLWSQCVRQVPSDGTRCVLGPAIFERARGRSAIASASSAIRAYLNPAQPVRADAISPFAFAELVVAYRNRSAGHGAPDRLHLERFAPLLEAAVVEWLEVLDGLRQHPLLYVSEIRVERRRYVYAMTRLMGTTQMPQPDFSCGQDEGFPNADRALFVGDPASGAPVTKLHPLAIYANDEVFLLQRSDLNHSVDYLCHHTGASYSADHIYEDFKEQFAAFFTKPENRVELDADDIYLGCVRMSLLDGVIEDDERAYLEELRARVNLSVTRAEELENQVRREFKPAAKSEVRPPVALEPADTLSRLVEQQGAILRQVGNEILDYICRQPDPSRPLKLTDLASGLALARNGAVRQVSPQQLARLIVDVQNHGFAPGLVKKAGGYCVAEGHIAFKLTRDSDAKRAIARAAVQVVQAGARVGLDGGSTTLPIAEELVALLDAEMLDELTVVTNSLPIAQRFADFIERRGWTDEDARMRVLMPAGLIRPVTKAIAEIAVDSHVAQSSLEKLVNEIGGLDVCFVGGNGVTAAEGITMPTTAELAVKRFFLSSAVRPFIVADASKFGLRHAVQIAGWHEPLTLLTNRPTGQSDEFDAVLAMDRNLDIMFAAGPA